MKQFVILLSFLLGSLIGMAQKDGYTISLDKQPLVQGSYETAETVAVKIKKAQFKKAKALLVKMTGALADAEQNITLMVMDDLGTTFLQVEANAKDSLRIDLKQIVNALNMGKTLKIYSFTLPKDPAKAAAIRPMRRLMGSIQTVSK